MSSLGKDAILRVVGSMSVLRRYLMKDKKTKDKKTQDVNVAHSIQAPAANGEVDGEVDA